MRPTRIGVVLAGSALLVAGCEFKGLYDLPLPGGGGRGEVYRVTAEFSDVMDLVPHSAVKVNNVTVGSVEDIWLDGWHARVRLRVEDHVRLPDNAIAELRQTSLLGEKYVSLAAPPDKEPRGRLSDGDLIPLARSDRTPEVEEVLSALSLLLNGGGVAQLRTITVELNKVMEGREDRIRDLLDELDTFLGGLDEQRQEIVRAIENIDKLAATLADQRDTIESALDSIGPGLEILADQRAQLTRMLTDLSELGAVGTRVINQSKEATLADLRALAPILTRLSEAGESLPEALELLVTFPFPRNVTDAVRGDYTNLRVRADLDVQTLMDNLSGGEVPREDDEPAPSQAPTPDSPDAGPPPTPLLPCPTVLLPGVEVPGLCPSPSPSPTPTGDEDPPGDEDEDEGGGPLCPLLCVGAGKPQAATADSDLAVLLLGGLA